MFRSLIFTCITILLSSCTVKNDRLDRVNFEELLEELFSKYSYKTEVSFYKEELDVSNAYIPKNKMSKSDFEVNIEKELLVKGWIKIQPLFDDQNIYCYDEKNELSIIYPTKDHYVNNSGDSMDVSKENLDKWIILYRYNMYGNTNCENYFKNNRR